MRVQERLAANVKALRKQKGLSQSELAEASCTSLFSIQAVESGRRWPSTKTLEGIAIALGVEEDQLFACEQEPVGSKIDDLMAQLQAFKQPQQNIATLDPDLQKLFERAAAIPRERRKAMMEGIAESIEACEEKLAREAQATNIKKNA